MKFEQVVQDLRAELGRAIEKHPWWPTDPLHAIAIVVEEVGEVNRELVMLTYEPEKTTQQRVIDEARQAMAMTARFYMSIEHLVPEQSEQVLQKTLLDTPECHVCHGAIAEAFMWADSLAFCGRACFEEHTASEAIKALERAMQFMVNAGADAKDQRAAIWFLEHLKGL